jgi:hypothetical protein
VRALRAPGEDDREEDKRQETLRPATGGGRAAGLPVERTSQGQVVLTRSVVGTTPAVRNP